jgi:hypothetical protein
MKTWRRRNVLDAKAKGGCDVEVDFNGGVSRHVRQIIFELVTSVLVMLEVSG